MMRLPSDFPVLVKRIFKNKYRDWLKESISDNRPAANSWPIEINLEIPSEREALRQPEAVRLWISAWRSWQGSGTAGCAVNGASLVWSERRWRSLGTQSVPEKLIVKTPDDAAAWAGESARWQRAADRYKLLTKSWTALIDILPKYFNVLADYNESDFNSLRETLAWICANPNSNYYIRHIPIAGIDTKWMEARMSIVCELVAVIQDGVVGGGSPADCDFYRRCGLKPLPHLIRVRIPDPNLRNKTGGLADISAPLEEIANLGIAPSLIFIVENIQTALAFTDLKNSVVIMGLGYGVDVLGKIPWLQNARCVYWGDIDTHGFAILNRTRSYLPNAESVFMDEKTLLSHRKFWVEEKKQHTATELPLLNSSEQLLFRSLKNNTWGQHVRLEQERICWDTAWDILQSRFRN